MVGGPVAIDYLVFRFAHLGQFTSVRIAPQRDLIGVGFEVELQANHVVFPESLILTIVGLSQMSRSERYPEGIAMPLEDRDVPVESGKKRIRCAFVSESDRHRTDLFDLVWFYPGAERVGEKLCAETDSQDRLPAPDRPRHKRKKFNEIWVLAVLGNRFRRPEYNQDAEILRRGQAVVGKRTDHGEGNSAILQV